MLLVILFILPRVSQNYWNNQFKKKDKTTKSSTNIFVSLDARAYIDKYNLFTNHKVYYLGMRGIISESFSFNINLDRYLPGPKIQCYCP